MSHVTPLRTLGKIGCAMILLGSGLSCDFVSRIAAPPRDRVLWKAPGDAFLVAPSYDSTHAFFGSRDHQVVAVDRRTGTVRWRASTGSPGGTTAGWNTVVAGSVVVIGDVDLFAFDRATGAPAWSYRASDDDETGTHVLSTDGAVIYASSLFGRVYAIDSRTGVPLWIAQLPGPPGVRTTTFDPTIGGGQIFVGLWHDTNPLSGGLAALDAATGRVLWVREFAARRIDLDSYCNGGAVIASGLAIASASDGRIYGLDTAAGVIRWIVPAVARYPTGDSRALALAGHVVLASSNSGLVTGFDAATGAIRWSTQVDGASLSYHVAADSQLAIFSTSEIIAVDPQGGSVLWRTGVGKEGGDFWGLSTITPEAVLTNGLDGFYALKKH